jgi:hypothetical protein
MFIYCISRQENKIKRNYRIALAAAKEEGK